MGVSGGAGTGIKTVGACRARGRCGRGRVQGWGCKGRWNVHDTWHCLLLRCTFTVEFLPCDRDATAVDVDVDVDVEKVNYSRGAVFGWAHCKSYVREGGLMYVALVKGGEAGGREHVTFCLMQLSDCHVDACGPRPVYYA